MSANVELDFMSENFLITVIGTKDDVEKLWDALSQPNEYGGDGIRLDRNSIRSVEGITFPLWEAKGEMDKMPECSDLDQFKNMYTNFPVLGIYLYIYSDDEKTSVHLYGSSSHLNWGSIYKNERLFSVYSQKLLEDLKKWEEEVLQRFSGTPDEKSALSQEEIDNLLRGNL